MDPMDIHCAAKEGDLRWVRQLMEAGVSVDSRDNKGRTPLLLAAELGHHAVVEFLINCKLYPENRNPPVLLDIDVENKGAIGLFLQHDEDNYTLLHYASEHGWADIAQFIIEKGSESDMVNAATSDDLTPLILAVMHGREDVVALLLRSGADVNRRGPLGLGALHLVVENGNVRLLKLLLQEERLDLNPQEEVFYQTPLHYACHFRDRREVIKQLLAAGADVNVWSFPVCVNINDINDTNEETPLSTCLNVQDPSLEVINLFVRYGDFLKERDYSTILKNHVLKENVLKDVDLCTQSVINKFSYQTLPALYSSPYFASMLPSMDNLMLSTSQKDEVKNFVRRDIQQNTFCNVVRICPTALSALCVQCLVAYTTLLIDQ